MGLHGGTGSHTETAVIGGYVRVEMKSSLVTEVKKLEECVGKSSEVKIKKVKSISARRGSASATCSRGLESFL